MVLRGNSIFPVVRHSEECLANSEDGEDNVSGGSSRERLDKRQQGRKGNNSDSPGKVTRGSKRGESGNTGT
jgi:hypothetical protein